ncbi:hypothetical protein ATERTT37_003903 [Aspergillus terreus]
MNITEGVEVDPITRQIFDYAQKTTVLDLEDWVSILTLCLSPLIAHILSGVPTVVRRCPKPPSWIDTLCLYNPTSILWRYLAIADRRARYHRTWDPADMAASNALFWTSDGFDGSEEMMYKSRAFCTRVPRDSRTKVFSVDTVKTLITTAQGIQALFVLVRGIMALASMKYHHPFNATMAMDTVFYPLAVFGLLRLFAAPWLTELYTYAEHASYEGDTVLMPQGAPHPISYPLSPSADDGELGTKHATTYGTDNSTLFPDTEVDRLDAAKNPAPTGTIAPIIIRTVYILFICIILGICVCYVIPYYGAASMAVVTSSAASALILLAAVYILMSGMSAVLFTIYLIRGGQTTTTVIPCIRSWWYRLYTLVLMLGALALIILSGVFTRRTPCGKLTMFPAIYDNQVCQGLRLDSGVENGAIGFVIRNTELTPPNWMVPLDGWCSGTMGEKLVPFVDAESLQKLL